MMYAYIPQPGRAAKLELTQNLADALWIDLMVPTEDEVRKLATLGIEVPSLADMEEIEISNRLYRENDCDYMTAVLPGERVDGSRAAMPVCFILAATRLVTVRHHSPRPFLTYPERAGRATLGCATVDRLFVGLLEDIVARLADILETSGRMLDETASGLFDRRSHGNRLHLALRSVVNEAEQVSRVRVALLTIERILAFYLSILEDRPEASKLNPVVQSQIRDVQALEVHADFLSSRISLIVDTTLGMINLEQNNTVRILSVIAALFLPPTLIASIYGMNFDDMPELHTAWGYPMALGLMLVTVVATWLILRWKKWL